ncbi:hypothetical protein FACS189493_2000 [Spirochaetia bacterium]|nr:hypothetical protein FACS189493_2000 [Spirochaetia bacterium]
MVVAALVLGLSLSGCATMSSISGTSDPHGLFSSSAKVVAENAQEIASYSVILGLVDSGYAEYVTAVKQAESEGKTVTLVTTSYFGFFTKITAYAQ